MHRSFMCLLLLLTSCSVMGGNSRPVPVQFGGGPEGDACPLGEVHLHGAVGKAEIRSGPGSAYNVIDKISDGDRLFVCDKSVADRGWIGVVYPPGGAADDCGFTFSEESSRSNYVGDCISGWIESGKLGAPTDNNLLVGDGFIRVLVPREGCVQGYVAGLKDDGDGYLAVRAGPSTIYDTAYFVHNGQRLYICQTDRSGVWKGVVYLPQSPSGASACGLKEPSVVGKLYDGDCNWGWVHRNWVRTGKP